MDKTSALGVFQTRPENGRIPFKNFSRSTNSPCRRGQNRWFAAGCMLGLVTRRKRERERMIQSEPSGAALREPCESQRNQGALPPLVHVATTFPKIVKSSHEK
eukprot:7238418-Prymnesium_polylepis.1